MGTRALALDWVAPERANAENVMLIGNPNNNIQVVPCPLRNAIIVSMLPDIESHEALRARASTLSVGVWF